MSYFIRMFIAMVFASIIGWEREKVHKSAGIRTICFVSLAACLSIIFTQELGLNPNASFDNLRLASYLIAALGFVGSGYITKEEGEVHGLTTAALLLPVAFVGFFCGLESYYLAWLTTIFTYSGLILSYITKD